eukprot:6485160-Amphidinium_carterae.1
MHSKFDAVLVQALERNGKNPAFVNTANSGISAKEFLATYKGLWELVLPSCHVERVLQASDAAGWEAVATEMRAILHSSTLGKKLFGDAASTVIQNDVNEIMSEAQTKLKGADVITSDLIRTLKTEYYQKLMDLRHLGLIPSRHVARVRYHGLDVPVAVTCHEQHLGYVLAATTKELAVRSKDLPPLPGELEVCDITIVEKPGKVESSLLAEKRNARECLGKHVKIEQIKKKETVQGVVASLEAKLLRIDPEFLLEMKLMEHIFGEGGMSYVKGKWCAKCLSSASKHLDVRDAVHASNALKESKCPWGVRQSWGARQMIG